MVSVHARVGARSGASSVREYLVSSMFGDTSASKGNPACFQKVGKTGASTGPHAWCTLPPSRAPCHPHVQGARGPEHPHVASPWPMPQRTSAQLLLKSTREDAHAAKQHDFQALPKHRNALRLCSSRRSSRFHSEQRSKRDVVNSVGIFIQNWQNHALGRVVENTRPGSQTGCGCGVQGTSSCRCWCWGACWGCSSCTLAICWRPCCCTACGTSGSSCSWPPRWQPPPCRGPYVSWTAHISSVHQSCRVKCSQLAGLWVF